MPTYEYKATTVEGKILTGNREDSSQEAVITWLQESGYIPIYAQESSAASSTARNIRSLLARRKINDKQILAFTEQLATLMRANVPLDQSLTMLRETAETDDEKIMVSQILADVESGMNFSSALQTQGIFSSFYINMIKASEVSGNLDSGLDQLYQYLENTRAVRDKIMSAMLYPLILVVVAGLSLVVILTFVVPKISQVFEGSEQALPLPTQIVISMSETMVTYWWTVPAFIFLIFLYSRYASTSVSSKVFWQKILFKIPLVRELSIKTETAKFTHSLSTLSNNGVPLQTALPIAKATIGNYLYAQEIERALQTFKEGKSLYTVLKEIVFFPTLALQLIKVGEETGELPTMLKRVASIYEKETAKILQRLLTLLEPLLIVTLGIAIAGIIISMLMGIISINDLPF